MRTYLLSHHNFSPEKDLRSLERSVPEPVCLNGPHQASDLLVSLLNAASKAATIAGICQALGVRRKQGIHVVQPNQAGSGHHPGELIALVQ